MIKSRIKSYSEFSDEDVKIIRENIEKITTWAKNQNIRFEIEIPNDVYELKLFTNDGEIYLRVGGGTYNFEKYDNSSMTERYWIGARNNIPYAFEVIRNWREIKEEILKLIEFETKSKNLIYNFEV